MTTNDIPKIDREEMQFELPQDMEPKAPPEKLNAVIVYKDDSIEHFFDLKESPNSNENTFIFDSEFPIGDRVLTIIPWRSIKKVEITIAKAEDSQN